MTDKDTQRLPDGEIMIVEDSNTNLRLLITILTQAGYRVRPAVDGEMALRSVQAKLPDLILLDVKLPGMDGIEVCRRLKADPAAKTIPVIFISALHETECKVKALEIGGVDYITKPFSPAEVLTRIAIHINMHRLQQQLTAKSRELRAEIEVRKQTEQELERHRTHLEKMVAARTAELRESKTRYENVISMISDIVWSYEVDRRGRFIESYISPVADRLLKLPTGTIGNSFDKYFSYAHSEDLPGLHEIFSAGLAATAKEVSAEYRLCRPDDTICWVRSHGSAHRQPDGHVIAFGTTVDITNRKHMEEALRESEEQYKELYNRSLDCVYIHDFEGNFIDANPAALNLFGYDKEEIRHLKFASILHEDEVVKALNLAKQIMEHGPMQELSEFHIRKKNGEIVCVEAKAALIYKNGKPHSIMGTGRDITGRKHAEELLRHAYKMEAIGTLTGGIAHEFNNMLGIIIGNAELAADDVPEQNPAATFLKEIQIASLRAKDVVRKLLRVARKAPILRKPLQIGNAVTDSVSLLRRTISTTIQIRTEIRCTTEMILADSTEINQVMINLCNNAAHAMKEGTGILEILLETIKLNQPESDLYEDLQPGRYARLTVRDTGDGIAPEIMDRIFDPYFTTKDVDEGLGMGLAVVHGIVKEHEGAIRIRSELGKGTAVEVLFPLIEDQPANPVRETGTLPSGSGRILFIDDEESMVKMAGEMIDRFGYEVITGTDSMEALELFTADPARFDLVITDMAMPDMAGDRLAQEMIRIRPDIPIILCTGHSDRMDENKAAKLGIQAFIMKPLTKKELAKTIQTVLDKTKGPETE